MIHDVSIEIVFEAFKTPSVGTQLGIVQAVSNSAETFTSGGSCMNQINQLQVGTYLLWLVR